MGYKRILIFQENADESSEILECQQAVSPGLLFEKDYFTDSKSFLINFTEERGNEILCVIPSSIHAGVKRVNIFDFVQQLHDINPKAHIVMYSNFSNDNLNYISKSIEKPESNSVYLDSILENFVQKYPSLDKIERRQSIRHVNLINYLFTQNLLQAV